MLFDYYSKPITCICLQVGHEKRQTLEVYQTSSALNYLILDLGLIFRRRRTRHSTGASPLVSCSFGSMVNDASDAGTTRLQTVLALELRISLDCGGGSRRKILQLKSLLALRRWQNVSFSLPGDINTFTVGLDIGVFEIDVDGEEAEDDEADDRKQSLPLLVLPPRVWGTRLSVWWWAAGWFSTGNRGQLNTSSSSSSSELETVGVITAGGGGRWPDARRLCSSSRSCPMKLRLGEMMGRANLTSW